MTTKEKYAVIKRNNEYFFKDNWRCWTKYLGKAITYSTDECGLQIANYIAGKVGGKVYIIETTEREYDHERDDL